MGHDHIFQQVRLYPFSEVRTETPGRNKMKLPGFLPKHPLPTQRISFLPYWNNHGTVYFHSGCLDFQEEVMTKGGGTLRSSVLSISEPKKNEFLPAGIGVLVLP